MHSICIDLCRYSQVENEKNCLEFNASKASLKQICDNLTVASEAAEHFWNKSPKGHWSLTWVQWTLLLKVRFLSKWLIRKHDCHICEISPNSNQSQYFNSGYEDAFGLLLLHSDLKKKSFGEGAPHWPIFAPPWIHLWADLAENAGQGYDYFIPTKFGQHPSICSVGKAICSHTY